MAAQRASHELRPPVGAAPGIASGKPVRAEAGLRLLARTAGLVLVSTAVLKGIYIENPAAWIGNAMAVPAGTAMVLAWCLVAAELFIGLLMVAAPRRAAWSGLILWPAFLAAHVASSARPDLGVCPCLGIPYVTGAWSVARIALPGFLVAALVADTCLILIPARRGVVDSVTLLEAAS